MGAECLALRDYALHFFVRKALLVAVFRSPTALAVEVTRARGVKKDYERHVAVKLFAISANGLCAVVSCVKAERHNHFFDYIAVNVV